MPVLLRPCPTQGLPMFFAVKNRGVSYSGSEANMAKEVRFTAMPTQGQVGEMGDNDGLRHHAL